MPKNDTAAPLLRDDLADLLDRAAAGDTTAAAAVYDRVGPAAYRLVHLVVGDGDLAQEVCREAFRLVWEQWRAPSPVSARTWVLMLAHRTAVDRVRVTRGGAPRVPVRPTGVVSAQR